MPPAPDDTADALRPLFRSLRLRRTEEARPTPHSRVRWSTRAFDASALLDPSILSEQTTLLLLLSGSGPPAYALRRHPGAYIVTGALSDEEQTAWSALLLNELLEPPAQTSLSAEHGCLPPGLWRAACSDACLSPDARWLPHSGTESSAGLTARALLRKLRWATLGAPYDWSRRTYASPAVPSRPVPPTLCEAACTLSRRLCGQAIRGDVALVNLYYTGDTLGPHVDDAESPQSLKPASPIVAFSLGCPGVLLLGAPSDGQQPTAILLRSGDAVVLSGESRAAPHAMPRALTPSDECSAAAAASAATEALRAAVDGGGDCVAAWMAHCRVNMSLRDLEPAMDDASSA